MTSSRRPAISDRGFTSEAVEDCISRLTAKMRDPELAWLFANCFPNTLDTTVQHGERHGKPDTFVITGDISAMWLRDSTAQVWPYLRFAREDEQLRKLLAGVVHRQVECVLIDPYANAFNFGPTASLEWSGDRTDMKPGVFERKYELDSLCAVLRLSRGYYDATGDSSCLDARWGRAADLILETIRREQEPPPEGEQPLYTFERMTTAATDTLPLGGKGNPWRKCGLSRSPFRPSDDATIFPFLIPSNAMAVTELRHLSRISAALGQPARSAAAAGLAEQLDAAIRMHAIVEHPECGRVFAFEVDGYGSYHFMDDANVPSLLSFPYIGYCEVSDEIYRNTRKALLSFNNPYYSEGTAGKGIGGPHIGPGYIWPISIIIRALTSEEESEVASCLEILKHSHAGTGFMHESFWKDDPSKFTRKWFAWANTLFGELILHVETRWPSLL